MLFKSLIVPVINIWIVVSTNLTRFVLVGFKMVIKLFYIIVIFIAKFASRVIECHIIVPVNFTIFQMVLKIILAVELQL